MIDFCDSVLGRDVYKKLDYSDGGACFKKLAADVRDGDIRSGEKEAYFSTKPMLFWRVSITTVSAAVASGEGRIGIGRHFYNFIHSEGNGNIYNRNNANGTDPGCVARAENEKARRKAFMAGILRKKK